MRIVKLFKKLIGADARMEFQARIVAAVIIGGEVLSHEQLEKVKAIGRYLGGDEYSADIFSSEVNYFVENCLRNEADINALVKSIRRLAAKHPHWPLDLPLERLRELEDHHHPLQERVLEFIDSLQHQALKHA